jgi:hypothetical protein
VKTAWLADQKENAWRKTYEEMRAKYTMLLPAVPDRRPSSQPAPAAQKEVPVPSGEGGL